MFGTYRSLKDAEVTKVGTEKDLDERILSQVFLRGVESKIVPVHVNK